MEESNIIWTSNWFNGVKGHQCRIAYDERGNNLLELLEYSDGERHRFEWQGETLIRGTGFSRLGLRCLEVPEAVVQEIKGFLKSIPDPPQIHSHRFLVARPSGRDPEDPESSSETI